MAEGMKQRWRNVEIRFWYWWIEGPGRHYWAMYGRAVWIVAIVFVLLGTVWLHS